MDEQPSVNDPDIRRVRRVFAFLGILLVMVGQILVYTTPVQENTLIPPSLWINIAGMALFAWSQRHQPSQRVRTFFARLQLSGPTPWIIISLALSLASVLMMVLFTIYRGRNYLSVLTFWLFAAACYIGGFAEKLPSVSESKEWLKLHRYELLGVGLITLLGFVLRFYRLGEVPRVVNGDEGRIGVAALSTISPPYANPFALWENFGALYLQGINYAFNLFGVSSFSLRLLPAIGGTLAIPALYLLARQIFGHRVALIAAALIAISHTQIHFSRTVAVAYIQGTWLIPLELYFLLSGLIKRSSWRTAIGGVLLAIHFNVYLDSQIVVALILIYMLVAFLFLRPWFKPALQQAFVFWGAFGIMILPELVYIWQQPGEFLNRINKDGTIQSGWLAQTMASTGHGAAQLLVERIIHVFLSVIYYPSVDFYGSPVPMLSLISAMLFLLGLGIAFWKTGSPNFLLLNGYFWAGIFAIGIFSTPPASDTYRVLMVLPAVLLMAAIGLDHALYIMGLGWTQAPKVYVAVTAFTLSSLLLFNVWTYYFDFAGRCLYGNDIQTRFASFLGNYVRTIDRETKTYLLSDQVFIYGTHESVDFLSGRHPIANIAEPVDTLTVEPDEAIIASPYRIAELRTWADSHPGGVLEYQYDCQNTMLLAYRFP